MRKIAVDFMDLTPEIIDEIVKVYPQGFGETDMVSFTNVDDEIDHRIKVKLNGTLFMIKKSALDKHLNDQFGDKYDEDYFSNLRNDDESCDAEFC